MVFNIDINEKSVPWYNYTEFLEVFSWLSDPELSSKYMAISRLKIWQERAQGTTKQCPIAIIGTIYILHTMLQDGNWNWSSISNGFKKEYINNYFNNLLELFLNKDTSLYESDFKKNGDYLNEFESNSILSLQKQYCISIIRIINMFVDQGQFQTYARPISTIASELEIPQILVEIRHQATHGSELPSLETCRIGGILMFFFLYSNYWEKQFDSFKHSILKTRNEFTYLCKKLIVLMKNLNFNWNVHEHLFEFKSHATNKTLMHSLKKYNNIYYNSLLNLFLNYILKSSFFQKKVIKSCDISIENTKNKENLRLKRRCDEHKNKEILGPKTKNLKKWIRKCFNNLPKFYILIKRILNIINENEFDESVLENFLFRKIIEDFCPLCSPIALLVVLYFLHYMSNNLKLEVLSKLVFVIIKGLNKDADLNDKNKNTTYICKTDQKIKFLYWLRLLLPDFNDEKPSTKFNLGNIMYKDQAQTFEIILLLTFNRGLNKGTKWRKELDYEKMSRIVFESRYSMLMIFCRMMSSIPNLLVENGSIPRNYYILNFIELISDLKLLKLTSNLLKGLYNAEKETYLNNVLLFKKFLNFFRKSDFYTKDSNSRILINNERGIVVEEQGLTPLLKVGTSWDKNFWMICNHLGNIESVFYKETENLEPLSINLGLKLESSYKLCSKDSDVFSNQENGVETISLPMEELKNLRGSTTSRDIYLLKAEANMRKNIGLSEIMYEKAININWNSVENLFKF